MFWNFWPHYGPLWAQYARARSQHAQALLQHGHIPSMAVPSRSMAEEPKLTTITFFEKASWADMIPACASMCEPGPSRAKTDDSYTFDEAQSLIFRKCNSYALEPESLTRTRSGEAFGKKSHPKKYQNILFLSDLGKLLQQGL